MFNILKAVVNVAMLPVDVTIDFATMGGELVDKKSFTGQRFKKIMKNVEDVGK